MHVEMSIPPTLTLRDLRGIVSAWARAVHAEPADLTVIVTELVTNARNAATPGATLGLQLDCRPGELTIRAQDDGPGFELRSFEPPPLDATRGRGLAMVAQLADLAVETRDGQTTVTARTSATTTIC